MLVIGLLTWFTAVGLDYARQRSRALDRTYKLLFA